MDITYDGESAVKAPEGTRDWFGKDIVIREKIVSFVEEVFKRHGAVSIDTPVFELLNPAISEQDRLPICKLADQGGELAALRCSLRDSLTRWLLVRGIRSAKIYQIAKEYRRVTDAFSRSVLKETYRCHFSIVGVDDGLLVEAEVLRVTMEVLDGLKLGGYAIKVNHSAITKAIFQVCQVSDKLWPDLLNSVNKISKTSWETVYREMTRDIGLEATIADKLGEYVAKTGGRHLLYDLLLDEELSGNSFFLEGVNEMKTLFDLLETFEVMPKIAFDLSLTHRGLEDTGLVYEVVTLPSSIKSAGKTIDSVEIASGAHYKRWAGYLHQSDFPIIGIQFELEEISKIIQVRVPADQVRETEVDVYVMAIGGGFLNERMQVCRRLWDAGIKAEFSHKINPEPTYQFAAAQKAGAPFAAVLSEGDIMQGKVKIKEMSNPHKPGLDVCMDDVAVELAEMIRQNNRGDKEEAGAEGQGDDGEGSFRERVDRVRVQGGTVEMDGVSVEMDFAKIKVKDAEIEFEGAKFGMKKVKIEIRGSKEK